MKIRKIALKTKKENRNGNVKWKMKRKHVKEKNNRNYKTGNQKTNRHGRKYSSKKRK
jgi:hypothetical protein